jgi:acetoin utilization protein AcuC
MSQREPSAAGPLLVFGPWSPRYDLGPSHPLTPRRFGPGIDLLRSVAGEPDFLPPEPAADDVLAWVHDRDYIATVRRFSAMPFGPGAAGLGPGDTPAFAGMHEASAAVAGGSVAAMTAILAGTTSHAFHPGGGLHHAMRDRASGFCVYDDPALAIARARRDGKRVLYLDLDVHHGDGVQALHWDDPGVLTISIHQSGRTLFPGTGFVDELGDGIAAGTAVNLPMDPETGERGWLAAIRRVVPPLVAAFGPDVLVTQHGADAHAWDPLANLRVTTTAMGAAARLADSIAHRWAGGRWLATGGGGYDAYRVVPRMWTLVWLAARHADASLPTPEAWRERWAEEAGRYGQSPLPEWLNDEPNAGLRMDPGQEDADRRAGETADLVRELVVPVLLRAAADLGWWDAAADLDRPVPEDRDEAASAPANAAPIQAPPAGTRPEIIDAVDAATWQGLRLAARTLPPADPSTGHRLIQAALASPDDVLVTAAIIGEEVVGAVISATSEGRRVLLGLGVAPAERRQGLATELLRRHVGAGGPEVAWDALVTVAERDPIEPLPRAIRATIARRLLEMNGFAVERPLGPVGSADPRALLAHRR